jgi:hypothetical protein
MQAEFFTKYAVVWLGCSYEGAHGLFCFPVCNGNWAGIQLVLYIKSGSPAVASRGACQSYWVVPPNAAQGDERWTSAT